MSARYETLGVVMDQVGKTAGYTSAQMDNFEKSLEKTGISMIESRQSLARLVQAHVDLSNSARLARIAQDSAVIGNMNSSEAFQSLVYGIQSANVHVLRTIGINVNFESSYKTLADQLGKTTNELTEQEKTQARLNAVFAAGDTIVGTYEAAMETAGKQILSMKRYVDDLKVSLGEAFGPALTLAVEQFTSFLKDVTSAIKNNKSAVQDWGINFKLALISVEAEIQRLAMLLDKIGGSMTGVMAYATLPLTLVGMDVSKVKYFSDANENYKKRYEAGEKNLESLGALYEQTLKQKSPEYKESQAANKAAKDRDEAHKSYMDKLRDFHDKEKALMQKSAADSAYNQLDDPIVNKAKSVDRLTQKLKESNTYQTILLSKGSDSADKWLKDSVSAQMKPVAEKAAKADKDALKSAKEAARDYQQAIDDINDSYAKSTLNKFDSEKYDAEKYYRTQSAKLWGASASQQADAIAKLDAIKASKLADIAVEQSAEQMNLMGGNPFANASQTIDALNAARLQSEQDITAKINQLTLSEHDYKIWSLNDEYEKAKETAQKNGTDTDAYMAKLKQYYDLQINKADENSTWLIKLSDTTAQAMEKDLSTFFFDVITGKLNSFQSFATSVFQSVAKIASNYMGQVAKEVMFGPTGASAGSGSVGGLIGKLVGWISGSSSGATTLSNGAIVNASGVVVGMHSGGVVGQDYTFTRNVPMSLFSGASRFHDGLYPDEFPAILQKGELVIPKNAAQTSAGKQTSAPNVSVNVHNSSGTPVTATKQDVRWNGQEMVVNLWMDAVARNVNGVRDFMGK